MIIRKLKRQEAELTRPLWERIFYEDGKAFLDYYYSIKTEDNAIYVIQSEGDIRSMLQLNPYQLKVEKQEVESCYVVAVATDAGYRKRGYMSELLKKSVRDMYVNKMPFIFLMPAAESIYFPHHFRMIYDQQLWKPTVTPDKKLTVESLLEKDKFQQITIRKAIQADCKRIAQFAERILRDKYQVYAKRDWAYYERLLLEQESQDGGILLAEYKGEIKGAVIYDKEGGFSVREPLVLDEDEQIFEEGGLILQKAGKKPIIMARIVHLESLLEYMNCREDVEFSFEVYDPVIRENNKIYVIRGNQERIVVRTKPAIKGRYDDIQRISIGALTSVLFGYKSLEKIEEEEQEIFSDEFKEAVRKLNPLKRVFINEIV